MSYLNQLRLHFSGRFQANTSTVNNDPGHFQNNAFQPSYQELQGPGMNPPNGWFNPQGDGGWRLMGCKVTAAWTPEGQVSGDPVLDYLVADSDSKVCGKLVDLDPEQQLVSEIWGLQVRICNSKGETLLCGDYEPAGFMDIWTRATGGGGGDTAGGAMYQSVLTNLKWGDTASSSFLTKLKALAADGLLSIKFNLDGVNLDNTSPNFMSGRIVGTIGPASKSEPKHMVIGRQFMAAGAPSRSFFIPKGKINFFPGVVDGEAGGVFLDLGNALSTSTPGGQMNDLGDLTLGYYDPDSTPDPVASAVPLAVIPAGGADGYASNSNPDWYPSTGGVVLVKLTEDQFERISAAPLVLYVEGTSGRDQIVISEPPSGAFLRADTFVYRLSPGDSPSIEVVASKFGEPLPGVDVVFEADSSQLQQYNLINPHDPPKVGTPLTALGDFNVSATTLDDGRAPLTFTASDPGTPRNFRGDAYGIDGQVYGLRPKFADDTLNPPSELLNEANFVSILLWSGWKPSNPITWDDLEPIFQQSANLYPVMSRFLDLGDYDSVVANVRHLKLAFELELSDPNSMPVTRDLSPAKRDAILAWLDKPLPGTQPKAVPESVAAEAVAAAPPDAAQGGKAAAAVRRIRNLK